MIPISCVNSNRISSRITGTLEEKIHMINKTDDNLLITNVLAEIFVFAESLKKQENKLISPNANISLLCIKVY